MAEAQVRAVITAKDEASHTLRKVQGNIEDLGHSASQFLGGAMATATRVAAVGLAAVGAAAIDVTKSFMESEKVGAQLDAVLKSTAGAAGVSRKQLDEHAKALQNMTKFSDEAIGSAQALLLTFTEVKGPLFKDATKIVLDMSQALGQDLKSSSIQVGKALQDPVLGVTALRRVGVNFNEAQQKVIKNLVETGQKAKAQALIMKELQTEFGGSAQAAGETFGGQLVILGNKIDDVKEKIGLAIVTAIGPFIDKAEAFVDAVNWEEVLAKTIAKLVEFKDKFIEFTAPIRDFISRHREIILAFFEKFGQTAIILIPILAGLALAFSLLANPLFILTSVIAGLLLLWEKNQALFLVLTAVIGPLVVAFVALRTAIAFSNLVTAMNTAILALTGTNIAATAATAGFAGAVKALLAVVAGPVVLTVIGIGLILAAKKAVDDLAAAWKGQMEAENLAQDTFSRNVARIKGMNISPEEKKRRIGLLNASLEGRALGGPVNAGQAYVVGERGPEVFMPDRGGQIVPNNQVAGATVNATVNVGIYAGTELEKRRLARELYEALRDAASAQNMSVTQMLGGR